MATLRVRRKGLIHGMWRVPNDATDLSQMHAALPPRRAKDYQVVEDSRDPKKIAEAATEASNLCGELETAIEELRLHVRSGQAAV